MTVKKATGNELSAKTRSIQRTIKTDAEQIEVIVDKLIKDYCKELDSYVKRIYDILKDTENPPTGEELDDFVMNLATLLYFTSEAQESLGIKEDVAKAVKMELYNESYNDVDGTVADKKAAAELTVQAETIVHIAYSRAYKKVKLRMEAASELLQSIKKVMSRRIAEFDLSKVDPGKTNGR